MTTVTYNIIYLSIGVVALFALVGADESDRESSIFKLLRPDYNTIPLEKLEAALDLSGPSEEELEPRMPAYPFGSYIHRPPFGFTRDVMEDKRFGYVGSRGKRTDRGVAFMTLTQLLNAYDQRANRPASISDSYSGQEDSYMTNNKRQPHFGFHGVRG